MGKNISEILISCILNKEKDSFAESVKSYSELQIQEALTLILLSNDHGCSILGACMHVSDSYYIRYFVENFKISLDAICNDSGHTLLQLAVLQDNYEIVVYLLNRGARVNLQDRVGKAVLHYAMTVCNLKIVKLLIKHGARLDCIDNVGNTPLDCVALLSTETLPAVDYILGVRQDYTPGSNIIIDRLNLEFQDSKSSKCDGIPCLNDIYDTVFNITRLIETNQEGKAIEAIRSCKFPNLSFSVVSVLGWTLLHRAAWLQKANVLQAILNVGVPANVPHVDTSRCCTALHYAAQNGSLPCLTLLLKYGANVNAIDAVGQTPFFYSISYADQGFVLDEAHRIKVMDLLVSEGARVNTTDVMGWSPMHIMLASKMASPSCMKEVVDYGAEYNSGAHDDYSCSVYTQEQMTVLVDNLGPCSSVGDDPDNNNVNPTCDDDEEVFTTGEDEEDYSNVPSISSTLKRQFRKFLKQELKKQLMKEKTPTEIPSAKRSTTEVPSTKTPIEIQSPKTSTTEIPSIKTSTAEKLRQSSNNKHDSKRRSGSKSPKRSSSTSSYKGSPRSSRGSSASCNQGEISLDVPVTASIMTEVASMLGTNWKRFARKLPIDKDNFVDAAIEGIESRYHMEGLFEEAYQSLRKWRSYQPTEARVVNLVKKLEDEGLRDIAEKIVGKMIEDKETEAKPRKGIKKSSSFLKKFYDKITKK